MQYRETLTRLRQNPLVRYGLLAVGVLFLLATLVIGPLPGPGGLVTFAIGAGLVLQNSMWARRRYVELKRKQPKIGGWADWGLRRASARRREALKKQKEDAEN
jgi:Putative transmembrane protein (PGPGW)